MKKQKNELLLFLKVWVGAAGVIFLLLLAIQWPCKEEILIWLPNNSQIKNPVESGVYIPILNFRAGESIIMVPFKQFIERFENNVHEVFIQSDGDVWYVTEASGMKFAAKKEYLEPAVIHEDPIIEIVKFPAIAIVYYGLSGRSIFWSLIVSIGLPLVISGLQMNPKNNS